ncbi:MAG TPA: hypothetical protein VG245_10405 [Candidatus Dormibacteraeota bacterium]|jgi:hypothetical protein|nr:hypothetical protein [Candidatus Dormibacteraeota bacterium]
MTKRNQRRLALSTETVRDLTGDELSVAVGATQSGSCPGNCPATYTIKTIVLSLQNQCPPSAGAGSC